jgi:hypothetical protein
MAEKFNDSEWRRSLNEDFDETRGMPDNIRKDWEKTVNALYNHLDYVHKQYLSQGNAAPVLDGRKYNSQTKKWMSKLLDVKDIPKHMQKMLGKN